MSRIDKLSEQQARIAMIRASEIELTQGAEAALQAIGSPNDPIRMRATISVLVREKRYRDAADLIQNQVPNETWIDLASLVFASLGDIERGQEMVRRAEESSDPLIMRRTRYAFAEGLFEHWRERRGEESLLALKEWQDTDRTLALTVVEVLEPLVSLVRANRLIRGDLELGALAFTIKCAHVLGDDPLINECSKWLIKHTPVPLFVVELCIRGFVDCPKNLPGRLRGEHPGEFQASFLAALLDRELFARPHEAFDEFARLASEATTDSEKESTCIALFETCGRCSEENFERAIQLVAQLRPTDTRLLGLLRTFQRIAAGDLVEAREQLDAIRDESDGCWWQAEAQLREKLGDEDAAQVAWEKASELLPHPEVIGRSVQASLDRRRYESAVRGLKKLLTESPDSEKALRALAWAYIQLGEHDQAAAPLERLVSVDAANVEYRLAFAQSLARSNRHREGIRVLQPLCDGEEPPVKAIMLQSELLEADGKANSAFDLLKRIVADNWDDPRFLLIYVNRAYATGEDQLAHEAFTRLVELRREGKVAPELMQEGTLEQLLDFGKEYHNRREALQTRVVAGRMPWLFAEDVLGNPPTWAWLLHTQSLPWLSEEPLSRAAFSVYATNAFTLTMTDGDRRLSQIEAPPRGTEVVADLTALLTLHQLERLEQAAHYFGKLILPSSYGELRIRDANRFGQHQPSREEELKLIQREIDRRIRIVESDESSLSLVDEYSDDPDRHAYCLRDLLVPLWAAQKTTQDEIDDLSMVAHKPSSVDRHHESLRLGGQLLFDLHTLRTLARRPVFGAVLENFSVHLRAVQRDELLNELRAYQTARSAKDAHETLWEAVNQLANEGMVEWKAVRHEDETLDGLDGESPRSVHLDALLVALQSNRPLMVDDRVLQVAMYEQCAGNSYHAFGSDRLLLALADAGLDDASATADVFRRLMVWRYRFLVPSPELLVKWARQSLENLPGNALLDIAVYLHDCLRDPGLHCGLEQSEPPMPMAAKFVLVWIDTIATFLADVWSDGGFSDGAATTLTRWVGQELIPSSPRGLWLQPFGTNLSRFEYRSVVSAAVVQFISVQEQRRANLGLRTLVDALGLDEDEFLIIAAETIHAVT